MTDKVHKIREEVVEIVNSTNPFIPDEDGKNSNYEAGKLDAATKILQIIDSLEEPVSEGLEEEIQKTIHNHFFDLNGIAIAGTSVYATVDDMVYIAKHFTNWQKDQMMKNSIPIKIDSGGTCGPFNEGTWIQAILLSSKRINLSDKYRHMIIEVKED